MREKTLSDYDFGYDDNSNQPPADAAPKWFREYMEKAGEENKALREQLAQLQQKEAKAEIGDKFKAAGYQPGAAALFSGEPAKVDDWLKANGEFLAKLPAQEGEETQAPAGPPQSTVSAEGQAQMQQMAEAGVSGVAEPQGSDKELAAALAAAATPEDFAKIMRANGNRHDWS